MVTAALEVAKEDKQEAGNTNHCFVSILSIRKAKRSRKGMFESGKTQKQVSWLWMEQMQQEWAQNLL